MTRRGSLVAQTLGPVTGRSARRPMWAGAASAVWLALACFATAAHADPNPANDTGAFPVRVTPRDIWPPAPVTDLAGVPGAEGQVLLQWTAPDESLGVAPKAVPVAFYDIRYAAFDIDALGGDTTAWFDAASPLAATPALTPGSQQFLLGTLPGGVTYYFGLRSMDDAALVSDIDVRAGSSATQARIPVKGIRRVNDLRAASGAANGSIDLTWTQPDRIGALEPLAYDLRASTLGNIANDAQFLAAQPVAAFSPSALPPVGAPNGAVALTLTGLQPTVTYYFALRTFDSGAPAFVGSWLRSVPQNFNVFNSTVAKFLRLPPDPVTDLTASITGTLGQAQLIWTAPAVPGGAAVVSYTIKYSTLSIADFFGSSDFWWATAPSTTVVLASTATPGQLQKTFFNGLSLGTTLFFAIRSQDVIGQISNIDVRAQSVIDQARILFKASIELVAAPGSESGSITLTWTEPGAAAFIRPAFYDIRASSLANISNNVEFEAADPLAAVSRSEPPTLGAGGGVVAFPVTGLVPHTTYFFAIRLKDSGAPQQTTGWLRDVGEALNQSNFAAARFLPRTPDPITDLAAAQGTLEGEVLLTWTAPRNQNFVAISSYAVRFATFTPAALGGDATAWFNLAGGSAILVPAGLPGAAETLLLGGLAPYATYYFGVRPYDVLAEEGALDVLVAAGAPAFSKPRNLPPATPAGLAASAGRNKAPVSWSELNAAGKGLDFAGYRLYRSTLPAANYGVVLATTSIAVIDKPLTPYVTHYFKVSAFDVEGLESGLSSEVSAIPYTLPPMEPFGFDVNSDPVAVSLRWGRTIRFSDAELFDFPDSPTVDELAGYQVQRSTDICAPFTLLTVKAASEPAHTDAHGGGNFYYQVRGFNSLGVTTNSVILDMFGAQVYKVDDCQSRAVVANDLAAVMRASSNTFGQDILMLAERHPERTGGKVLQAVSFRPMLGGAQEMKGFYFERPVKIQLHFVTQGGVPVPQTAGYAPQDAYNQKGTYALAAGGDVKDLGIFWNNGIEYKKLYGTVDALNQTVTVLTPNVGEFQIRSVYRDAGVTFDISNITSRIFSPNGDGLNDQVIFLFDNPRASAVTGKVYDMRGAFVADMKAGPQPDTLRWDGKMHGRAVTGGVYLYEIRAEGKTFNGTVVVAR